MAIGIRLAAHPRAAAAQHLNRRPEAPPARAGGGRFLAGIEPHLVVQRGASPDKATTSGKTPRRRTTWFPHLTRSLMFMAQLEILSPEIPGFGRARHFPQVPGSLAILHLVIALFRVRSFQIALQALAAGVRLAIRSTVSVAAFVVAAGTAVSDSVSVYGPDGVSDLAGLGSAMEACIGTILGGAGRDTVATGIQPAICMAVRTLIPMMTLMRSHMLEMIRMRSLPRTIQTAIQARRRLDRHLIKTLHRQPLQRTPSCPCFSI